MLNEINLIRYNSKEHRTELVSRGNVVQELEIIPVKYLNEQCLRHGSSYDGRIASFRYLTQTFQKSAVMISELTNCFFFPTLSADDIESCVWLNYSNILKYQEYNERSITKITFVDGSDCILQIDRRSIRKQILRCELFLEKLYNR